MEREWRTDCWIVHEEQKRMTGSEAAHQHQLDWSPLWNGFGRGVFFFCLTEAAYLAPEFAVLKAMRGENNKKRQQHCQWRLKVTEGPGGSSAARSLWCGLLPMYLALSSRRSFASFCRCSELIESVGKRTELLFGLLSWTCSSRCISSSFRHQEVSNHGFMSFF